MAADPDEALDQPSPGSLTRRAFVKGCVLASAGGVAALAGPGVAGPLGLLDGRQARRVDYVGATVLGGPAPQGLPLLPLAVDAAGRLRAQPAPPGVEAGVLDWYRYCGHAGQPNLQRGFQPADELLRYHLEPEKAGQLARLRDAAPGNGPPGWFADRAAQVAHAADFQAPGWGASMVWRSTEQRPQDAVPVLVLAVDPAELQAEPAARRLVAEQFLAPVPGADHALLGYVGYCKHFCCTPGWHESPRALELGSWDTIFCICHDSRYDPLRLRWDSFLLHEADPAEAG